MSLAAKYNRFAPTDGFVGKQTGKRLFKEALRGVVPTPSGVTARWEEGDSLDIEPVNLGLPMLKKLGAKWLVQMAEYFSDNPQLVVNGFLRAGIASALDHDCLSEQESQGEADSGTESDFGLSESEWTDTETQHI